MIRHMRRAMIATLVGACFLAGLTLAPRQASALDVGDVLKVGGIGLLVSTFGGEIDKFINTVLSQRGIQREGMTKVVPIVTVGSDKAVGAVQVIGTPDQVKRVQAVAEVQIDVGNRARARALLPVTTKSVYTDTIRSVGGVGVSANISTPF